MEVRRHQPALACVRLRTRQTKCLQLLSRTRGTFVMMSSVGGVEKTLGSLVTTQFLGDFH
jgi:hypothetical protein